MDNHVALTPPWDALVKLLATSCAIKWVNEQSKQEETGDVKSLPVREVQH